MTIAYMHASEIDTPALVVDLDIMERNLAAANQGKRVYIQWEETSNGLKIAVRSNSELTDFLL